MTNIRLTNYDVLAFRDEDGTFSLSQYKNHIGNSRFEVLVDMYREAFELSDGRGQDEECQKIVDRLVEVACHKHVTTAVNRGRFLFKITESGPDDWNECNETQAKSLVREVLSNSPFMEELLDEPLDIADLVSFGISSGPSNGMMQSAMLEGNKTGGRRSLLRRSASETDRKKTSRPEGDLLLDDGQLHVSMPIWGQPQRNTRPIRAGRGLGARQVSMPIPVQPISSLGARQVSIPIPVRPISSLGARQVSMPITGQMANGPDDWNECNETRAISLVREVLSSSPSMEELLDEPLDIADLVSFGISSGPSNEMMQSAMLEGNKRGRRRSLLRRSASETDRKKTSRPEGDLLLDEHVSMPIWGQPQRNTRSIRAVRPGLGTRQVSMPIPVRPISSLGARQVSMPITGQMANGGSTMSTENAMHVILVQNCRKLSQRSDIVGNNRLQVMLTLHQKGRYRELSPSEQDKVAGDLVNVVCQYWGGRILAEDGNSYNELGHDQAVAAMKALLSPDTVQNPAIAPIPTPSSSLLISGNKPPPKTPDLFKPAPASSLLANAPQPPEFLIQTSMEILRSHEEEPDESNLQSAAIRSLQQRKAKRGLAKKLGRGGCDPNLEEAEESFRLNNFDFQS